VAPGPVWTGAENSPPTGIRFPVRPVRSSVAIPTELPSPPLQTQLLSKTFVHKILFVHYFGKNITFLRVGVLRIGQVFFSVSCNVY